LVAFLTFSLFVQYGDSQLNTKQSNISIVDSFNRSSIEYGTNNTITDFPLYVPSTLLVINHLNDTLGGSVRSEDFSLVIGSINSTTIPNRFIQTFEFINGSETGTRVTVVPGSFLVGDNPLESNPFAFVFNKTFTGDCQTIVGQGGTAVGAGNISAGETKMCHINRIPLSR
jgi:hypothetical protein